MRARIFRRFLGGAFALLIATLVTLDVFVVRFASSELQSGLDRQLAAEAELFAAEAPTDPSQVAGWAEATARRARAEVAVVDAGGSVIATSAGSTAFGADNAAGGFRFGSAPLPQGGVLRLAASREPLQQSVADLRRRLLSASLLCVALAAAAAYFFMRSFARRVERLRSYVERMLEADVADSELPAADDELGALARSLRRTAPQIRSLFERLKVEGARREAILASMVEGVLAVDKDLKVTFCNDSFARTVGVRTPVAAGTPLLGVVRAPGLLEIMTLVLGSGERVERRLMLAGAEERSFEVLAGPLAGPSTHGALAILHDITKLERLERIRKDFVANVSHELRTPLASIRGYAETLLAGALEEPENNYKFVEIILATAIRLNNIASDLLTLSELESTRSADLPPKRISVRSALESAIRTVESGARVRGVRLMRGQIEDTSVMGHELRLEQALVNLLDNAVKFNRPNGEVRVESRAAGKEIEITIEDTGIGIPSDECPRIFERFYRVDKARSRAVGGTGLGLSIVKHVVEQMGGTIRVQSWLGKGSRFTLSLISA
jgi:two-component system phosphate regulon sensor histidine kinase PhoR